MSEVTVKKKNNIKTIKHAVGTDKKSSFLYTNKKDPYVGELYIKRDEDGAWSLLSEEAYNELSKEEKAKVGKEKVEFIRPWWALSKHVESISMRPTLIGGMERDELTFIENRLKYYLKYCSFVDLKFQIDENGFEHIEDNLWSELSSEDGVAPEILAGIMRIFTTKSPI